PRTDLAFAPPQEFPRPIVDPGHAEGTIVDDHVLNYPSSDLMDVLTGKKSFSGSLTVSVRQTVTGRRSSPATFSTGRPVTVFPSYEEGVRNGPQPSRARRCCAAKRTLDGEDRSRSPWRQRASGSAQAQQSTARPSPLVFSRMLGAVGQTARTLAPT